MARTLQKPVLNKELKDNARAMVGFAFWKHLEKFMAELEKEAMEKQDAVELNKAMSGHYFCESRAVRATLKRIREEVDSYLQ